MFAEFMNTYGLQILYALITAVAGAIGIMIKNVYTKYVNNQIKKDVVRTVVLGIEQIYKDLHGDEKLGQALMSASEMLAEKGIYVSDLELRMMIEATVAEFNDAFNKGEADPAVTAEITYE